MASGRLWKILYTVQTLAFCWLKADTGTIQDSGRLTTWQDQSGRDNHAFQIDPTRRPYVSPAQQNGLDVVTFNDGNNLAQTSGNTQAKEFLVLGDLSSQFTHHAATLFLAVRINTVAWGWPDGQPNWCSGYCHNLYSTKLNDTWWSILPSWSGNYGMWVGTFRDSRQAYSTEAINTGNQLYVLVSSDHRYEVFRNGASMGTLNSDNVEMYLASPFDPGDYHTLGGSDNPGDLLNTWKFFTGDFLEVRVYNTEFTNSQIDSTAQEIADKWGLNWSMN